jgi:hypothetical protein
MRCVVPGHFSGTLFKKKRKHFISCYFFLQSLYFFDYHDDFCKVLYSKNLESQENLKIKRSTTSIKMQGDLYPLQRIIFGVGS